MPDQRLSLPSLGWTPSREEHFAIFRQKGLEPGRIAVEDKHFYKVITAAGERIAQVTGKLLHTTPAPADLPKVGDWVAVAPLAGEAKAAIHHVLERTTQLRRKVAGREMEEQILATNVDTVFVVQALDSTFNPALLQRHLVMVFESGAQPVVVLNKADLCANVAALVSEARKVSAHLPLVVASAITGEGVLNLTPFTRPCETVVFIGTSGVGKSTLINDLCGEEVQATAEVRERDAKGRHTTTWRELIPLPNGGLVIDTPGMREFHVWTADDGMREAFADVEAFAAHCHFRDCTHTVENRCAVLEALAAGLLPQDRYQRFLKLRNELAELQEAQLRRTWRQRGRPGRSPRRRP